MKNLTSVAFLSVSMLAACGQKDSKTGEQPQANQTTTPAAAPSEMGQAAIIAVPVDSNGKEDIEGAQMHILNQAPGSIDSANVAQVFQSGSNADQFVSELDQTSSTESFFGWHNYRRFMRINYRCGYGPQGALYGYQGYANYQPTYYNHGSPYAMQYQNSYQSSSMNYYYYNQHSSSGSQGQQYPNQTPGQQYPGQQIPNQPQQPQYPNQPQQQPQQPQYPNQPQQQPQQPQYPSQPQQPQYPTPQLPTQPHY